MAEPGIGALGGPPSPASSSGRVASVGGHWGRGPPIRGLGMPTLWHGYTGTVTTEFVEWWVGWPEGSVEKPACSRTSFLEVCSIEHDWWRGFFF